MAWYITDGVLQRADAAPAENSILTDITGEGDVIIPEGVTSISSHTFLSSSSLTSIAIPSSVTYIALGAFDRQTHTILSISDSTTDISKTIKALSEHFLRFTEISISENHSMFRLENDLLISNSGKLNWVSPNAVNVIVPEGVTGIEDWAFYKCINLTSVTIPSGVTSIGSNAFGGCSSLVNITIPSSVTNIGDHAFWACSSLTDIMIPMGVTTIGGEMFSGCSSLTSVILPPSVTNIGWAAFYKCRSLASITIPPSVTSIEKDAFCGCHSLMSITIPPSVKCIEDRAFMFCSSLTNIMLSPSLTSIGHRAFFICSSLTNITIPSNVKSIGNEAFKGCKSITISSALWSELDKETLKMLNVITCPISLKDAPANVRLKLCTGFALNQKIYSEELHKEYFDYIKKNAAKLVEAAIDYPELLHLMCREKLIAAKNIDAFTEEAMRRENTEATAVLLDYQANVLTMKEVSKARTKKEQIREKQDDVIVERMEARADKVGIGGLNFVVTGKLNRFAKRDDIKAYIIERGGKLLSAMSAKTDYLITNDTDTGSAKNVKAAELGIVVITEDEFMKMSEGKKE